MDIFGVIVLGVTTAVGGGAVRDVILGIVQPAMFQHPVYTIVAMITSCIVFTILYLKKELLQGHNLVIGNVKGEGRLPDGIILSC